MTARTLPNLSRAQVVELQDALLANADTLLTSALAVLEQGRAGLAQSLAILGLEESGKAIAIHDRRIEIVSAPEGERFVNARLEDLWTSHQRKLALVHRFLSEEVYWFGVDPPNPGRNEERLGAIKGWSKRRDRAKQRGFYVEIGKTGDVLAPTDVTDAALLREVIQHVHQIGWQLRLGEHIEGKRQDELERGLPPADEETVGLFDRGALLRSPELRGVLEKGVPGRNLTNAAYRFNPSGADRTAFRNLGKRGYEAETRELGRIARDSSSRHEPDENMASGMGRPGPAA